MTSVKERESILIALAFILLAFVVTRPAPGGEAGEETFALAARIAFFGGIIFYVCSWKRFFQGFVATGLAGICLLATMVHPFVGPENTIVLGTGGGLFIVLNGAHLYRYGGEYCAVLANCLTGRINEI